MNIPKGKAIGVARVGEKGQIVIPKTVRELFSIKPGDNLVVLGDVDRGIAVLSQDEIMSSSIPGVGEFLSNRGDDKE